ncbi:MAG: ribonuclease P protein component [Pirellulales bacterium]|nr:ribonuclease P protein component [Pirellulales bacterium]
MASNRSFPKRLRLRQKNEFDHVFTTGYSVRDQWVRLFGCLNHQDKCRLGLAVSRRVGNAIARNRWKRYLREAFRLSFADVPLGLDLIVVPLRSQPPSLGDLRHSLVHLANRIHSSIEESSR